MEISDQPKGWQKAYVLLTKWFNTTFIGILVGIMTSAAVNILTGEKHLSLLFIGTVISYSILCIGLYHLLLFRQELDENEASRKNTQTDEAKRWQASCRWDEPDFVRRFNKIFGVFIVTLVGAVWLNIDANREGFKNNEKDGKTLLGKIDSVKENQNVIIESVMAQNKKIEVISNLQDSILKSMPINAIKKPVK